MNEKAKIVTTGDSTAFRPMMVTASRDLEVGFELEPITRKITLDKMRLYVGWPKVRNPHDDYISAEKRGRPTPIIMGNEVGELIGEMFIEFFGENYLGGNLSIKYTRIMLPEDTFTVRGVIRDKVKEGNSVRLILDIKCENQHDEVVAVATASGLVR